MSHLRVLICRVDEDADDAMQELTCVDLPPVAAETPGGPLLDAPAAVRDGLEAAVAQSGAAILRRLVELEWEELDA